LETVKPEPTSAVCTNQELLNNWNWDHQTSRGERGPMWSILTLFFPWIKPILRTRACMQKQTSLFIITFQGNTMTFQLNTFSLVSFFPSISMLTLFFLLVWLSYNSVFA